MQKNCSATQTLFTPSDLGSISVDQAAAYLSCSTRRVRALLSQNRLTGEKKGKLWLVKWPLQYTIGTRGPMIRLNRMYGRQRPKATLHVVK